MTCTSPQNRDAEPIKRSPNLTAVYLGGVQADPRLGHSADYRPGVLAVAAKKTIQEIEENRLNLAL
jgi:hypothetical protein